MDSISDNAGAAADLRKARNRVSDPTKLDRLPPHALESEQGVLGCCLVSPNECLNECIEKITPDAFYDLKHIEIFETMAAMMNLRQPIDTITLQQWLKDNGVLEQVGGIAYLAQLQDCVPSAANLSYYLDIVREKYLLRKMIKVCTETVGRIYEYEGEVDSLMDEVERDILAVRQSAQQNAVQPVAELVDRAMVRIEECCNHKSAVTGLATGFPDLDTMTNGLQPSNMIVIAARPSVGKTSLAFNIAENIVLNQKVPVGFFSLEMTADELILRALCSCARVNSRSICSGYMRETDFPKLTSAAGKLRKSTLYIDDTGGLSIMQLRARARRMVQRHHVKLIIVDYLQLLNSQTKRAKENRQQEISDISNGIKALAKELKIPIIILSQLNRDIEKGGWRKPRLSDIRESGAVEQDGDVIAFLYKPEGDDDTHEDAVPITLFIAKQRNGPTGDVNLTFLKPFTRFESAAKVDESDIPATHATAPDP